MYFKLPELLTLIDLKHVWISSQVSILVHKVDRIMLGYELRGVRLVDCHMGEQLQNTGGFRTPENRGNERFSKTRFGRRFPPNDKAAQCNHVTLQIIVKTKNMCTTVDGHRGISDMCDVAKDSSQASLLFTVMGRATNEGNLPCCSSKS